MSKQYPTSSLVAGWCIFAVGVAQLFIWAFWISSREQIDGKTSSFKSLFQLNPKWGPKSPKIRKEWQSYKKEMIEKRRVQAIGHSKLKQTVCILLGKYR